MPRLLATELMDDEGASSDPVEWRGTVDDLARINSLLGGRRLLRAEIDRLPSPPRSVLDVACGGADMPTYLLDVLNARGVRATCVALDRSQKILSAAAERLGGRSDVRLLAGDATALPFADRSFDLATMNLALHHFEPEQAVMVLREMARVARSVIVNDLRRSRLAWMLARVAFPLFTRNRFILHDGPISALRAYTPAEARSLASLAGWTRIAVRNHFAFRMALVGGGA
jgi:SAM-dependent methyltransferase